MRNRKSRRWQLSDDDPTSGLVNLVDVWMVFSVVLLITLISSGAIDRRAHSATQTATTTTTDADGNLEIIERDGVKVKKMRVTQDKLQGSGELLGTAYRLETGEVLYVPRESNTAISDEE